MGNVASIPSESQIISQDFDDAYAEVIVIERDDMTESSRQRLAYKYIDENSDSAWLTKTLVKNAAGEVISVIVSTSTSSQPAWVQSGIIT